MSSKSKATICRICKDPESLTAPLIACGRCKSRYHMGCPNPRILDRRATYTCSRCLDKVKKNADVTSAALSSRTGVSKGKMDHDELQQINAGREVSEAQEAVERQNSTTSLGENLIICKNETCNKPAKPLHSLCLICGLQERAKAAREKSKQAPAPDPRPFKKKKLYHLRPEDRVLVTNKRKRTWFANNQSSTRSEGPRASTAAKATAISDKTIVPVSSSRLTAQNQQRKHNISKPTHHSGGTASLGEPSRVVSSGRDANSPRMSRAVLPVNGSPHYDRPPYQLDNTSSNSHSKFNQTTSNLDNISKFVITPDNTNYLEEAPKVVETALNPGNATKFVYPEQPSQGSQLSGVDELVLQGRPSLEATPQPPSPMSDIFSFLLPESPSAEAITKPTTSPHRAAAEDDSQQIVESASNSGISAGKRTEVFDESVLDLFLLKQSQKDPFYEPTPKELLETQRWGTVDPRTIWPKRWNAAQKAEKMVEIQARGGRKANFGKILRPQPVKERLERGWDIHQSREKRDDEEVREAVQKLEELFGVAAGTIGNCVPKVIGGQLVMRERDREPEPRRPGRQKKEIPPGMYLVYGGQW